MYIYIYFKKQKIKNNNLFDPLIYYNLPNNSLFFCAYIIEKMLNFMLLFIWVLFFPLNRLFCLISLLLIPFFLTMSFFLMSFQIFVFFIRIDLILKDLVEWNKYYFAYFKNRFLNYFIKKLDCYFINFYRFLCYLDNINFKCCSHYLLLVFILRY